MLPLFAASKAAHPYIASSADSRLSLVEATGLATLEVTPDSAHLGECHAAYRLATEETWPRYSNPPEEVCCERSWLWLLPDVLGVHLAKTYMEKALAMAQFFFVHPEGFLLTNQQ